MKTSTKAVLLSALVIPGTGHLLLKRYVTATLLISLSLASLYYLISKSVEAAMQIVDKIQNGEVSPDIASIMDLVSKQSGGAEMQWANVATAVLVICWIIGIIDSYRKGRIRDKDDSAHSLRGT